MSEVLSLGGQMYVPAEATTFAQDAHFMALLHETGVDAEIAAGGDVLAAVLRSGRVADFLAAALQPVSGPWSPEFARDTAARFAALTDPQEKQTLLAMLGTVISGFFGAAPTPSAPSPNSSPIDATAEMPRRRRRRVDTSGSA